MEIPVSISIKNKTLYGIINVPHVQPTVPVLVLMCYGFNGDRVEQHRMSVTMGRLSEQYGITFARFDYRNQGLSDGCFDDFTFAEKIYDVKKIIEFIQCCYYCKPMKIFLVGFSNGCKVAIDACYEYDIITGIAIWNPILHEITSVAKISSDENKRLYKHPVTGRPYKKFASLRLNLNLLYEIRKDNSMTKLRELSTPVFCVLSEDDEQIDDIRHHIHEMMPSNTLTIRNVKGTDHLFSDLHSCRYVIELTLKWIIQQSYL